MNWLQLPKQGISGREYMSEATYDKLYKHFLKSFRVVFAFGRGFWNRKQQGIFHGWMRSGASKQLLIKGADYHKIPDDEGVCLLRYSSRPGCFVIDAFCRDRTNDRINTYLIFAL